ncbi:MAG: hypothetical protein Q9187_005650 [Circinaria calcarea]
MNDEIMKADEEEIGILAKEDSEMTFECMGYRNDITGTGTVNHEPPTRVMRQVCRADNMQRCVMVAVVPEAKLVSSGLAEGNGIDVLPVEQLCSYLGSLNKLGLARLTPVDHSNNGFTNAFWRSKALVDLEELSRIPF